MRLNFGELAILLLCVHNADSLLNTFRGQGKLSSKKMLLLHHLTASDEYLFTAVALQWSLACLSSFYCTIESADIRIFVKDRITDREIKYNLYLNLASTIIGFEVISFMASYLSRTTE